MAGARGQDAALLVGWWLGTALLAGATDKAAVLRDAMLRLRTTSVDAAATLVRELDAALPDDSDVQAYLSAMASRLTGQARPFGDVRD